MNSIIDGETPEIFVSAHNPIPTSIDHPVTAFANDRADSAPTFPASEDTEGGKVERESSNSPSSPPSTAPAREDVSAMPLAPLGDEVYRPAPTTNPVIDALIKRGLYRHNVSANAHHITCPWADEHHPGERREAYYHAPSEAVPLGSFFCPCAHSDHRRIGNLLHFLEVDRKAARCKPLIRVLQGEMHRIVVAAEKVLAFRDDLYRSNGSIVRLKLDAASGDVTTEPVTEQSLAVQLSADCDWEKFDARSDEWRRCDVPTSVVSNLLKTQTGQHLPVLTGLVRQPHLRRGDGVLVTEAGFAAGSGIYAAFDPADFHIPMLTKENAHQALRRLQSLLVEFEFAGEADRATVCSAMLTASIRDYLNVAPGFNITASSPGSGKSYLASVIAPFAGPGDARNMSYPGTNEEATKVVLSLALEQPAAVCFDDMPTDWLPHGAMNRMLTNGSVTERILGSSRVVTARASSFIMGTGNNIRPLRDMARRVASIYLLPQVESAATRDYDGRPAEEVRQNRGRYVSDALTIIAAWKAAGSPKADVPNVAGFGQWSDLCRHSLIWLGEPDPATSLIQQINHDPDKEQLGDLLFAWRDAFGDKPTLVRQVLKHIDEHKRGDLYDAVMELPCVERGYVNQSRFGRYLGRNKNRIVNGLQLVEAPHSERRAWAIVPISTHPRKPLPIIPDQPIERFENVWQDLKAEQHQARNAQAEPGHQAIRYPKQSHPEPHQRGFGISPPFPFSRGPSCQKSSWKLPSSRPSIAPPRRPTRNFSIWLSLGS